MRYKRWRAEEDCHILKLCTRKSPECLWFSLQAGCSQHALLFDEVLDKHKNIIIFCQKTVTYKVLPKTS